MARPKKATSYLRKVGTNMVFAWTRTLAKKARDYPGTFVAVNQKEFEDLQLVFQREQQENAISRQIETEEDENLDAAKDHAFDPMKADKETLLEKAKELTLSVEDDWTLDVLRKTVKRAIKEMEKE